MIENPLNLTVLVKYRRFTDNLIILTGFLAGWTYLYYKEQQWSEYSARRSVGSNLAKELYKRTNFRVNNISRITDNFLLTTFLHKFDELNLITTKIHH